MKGSLATEMSFGPKDRRNQVGGGVATTAGRGRGRWVRRAPGAAPRWVHPGQGRVVPSQGVCGRGARLSQPQRVGSVWCLRRDSLLKELRCRCGLKSRGPGGPAAFVLEEDPAKDLLSAP